MELPLPNLTVFLLFVEFHPSPALAFHSSMCRVGRPGGRAVTKKKKPVFLSLCVGCFETMYAIAPTGKAFLVGRTVSSLALGIGMRWRETEVEMVDRLRDPYGDVSRRRRCVLAQSTLQLLRDLGCTSSVLLPHLVPAKNWRFIGSTGLDLLREGGTYAGCSPHEPVYHIREGQLLRLLRTEFMRFGGLFSWGTEAHDAYAAEDGSDRWVLRKQYGPGSEAQMILSCCKHHTLNSMLLVDDPKAMVVVFDVRTGVCRSLTTDVQAMFGVDADVVMAVGQGVALHMWRHHEGSRAASSSMTASTASLPTAGGAAVSWRLISQGRSDAPTSKLHPTLLSMMASSVEQSPVQHLALPATVPSIRDDVRHHRVGMSGDALLPVDPFEWRGDRARIGIEEASRLVRALYGKKFHRGDVPMILREHEQDVLAHRAHVLRRDLIDAEHFLSIHASLPREESRDEPQMRRTLPASSSLDAASSATP